MTSLSPHALRRFYKSADVAHDAIGWTVRLDGRTVRTPAKAALACPTRTLAEAIAQEWAGQGETITPGAMPLTRLANVAIDRTGVTRSDLVAQVRTYAGTDLLCYRAPAPQTLVARQNALWDPPLDWAACELGARLSTTSSALAITQDPSALDRIAQHADESDDWRLTALAHAAGLTGSAILALALCRRAMDAPSVHAAAFLEEAWQIETWGADDEAVARGVSLAQEIDALAFFVAALTGQ
jgi:chaperone required for assembly of F1-ATPase